jgi:hypothetical protein
MKIRVFKKVISGEHRACCYKEIEVPCTPFPFVGMEVMVHIELREPDEVIAIRVDKDNDIVWASIGTSEYKYKQDFFTPEEALSQFSYETMGWTIHEEIDFFPTRMWRWN